MDEEKVFEKSLHLLKTFELMDVARVVNSQNQFELVKHSINSRKRIDLRCQMMLWKSMINDFCVSVTIFKLPLKWNIRWRVDYLVFSFWVGY